jgi:protein SCO1
VLARVKRLSVDSLDRLFNALMFLSVSAMARQVRMLVVPGVLAAGLIVALLGMRAMRDGSRTEPLPVIATIPTFSFMERSGRPVTHDDLAGQVWVADFFFTSCTGPCPEMSLRMRSLQQAVLKNRLNVRLVSVSLDPEIDRPKVLERYAVKYGADPDRWWFLTGEPDSQAKVHELVQTGFLQAVQRATNETPLIHSTYFLLIDGAGRIRGVYEGLDPASNRRILADARWLLTEHAES